LVTAFFGDWRRVVANEEDGTEDEHGLKLLANEDARGSSWDDNRCSRRAGDEACVLSLRGRSGPVVCSITTGRGL
jgi:hypothetical protein